jgi:hypothetical protein
MANWLCRLFFNPLVIALVEQFPIIRVGMCAPALNFSDCGCSRDMPFNSPKRAKLVY